MANDFIVIIERDVSGEIVKEIVSEALMLDVIFAGKKIGLSVEQAKSLCETLEEALSKRRGVPCKILKT